MSEWQDAVDHPVKYFLIGIVMLVMGAFGVGPARAFFTRIQKRNETGTAQAQSDVAQIRRTDSAADSFQILATRAIDEKNRAIDEKNLAVEVAQKATQAAIAQARTEMDEFRVETQREIREIAEKAKTEIKDANDRAQKAVDRAIEAELRASKAETEVTLLRAEIGTLRRRLDHFTGYDGTTTGVQGMGSDG